MGAESESKELRLLKESLESSIGRPVKTPRDFLFLRECLYARLHLYLSESTLKRVWGYMPSVAVRETTLDLLAQFLGYDNMKAFRSLVAEDNLSLTSSFILGRHLDVDNVLQQGDMVRLTWAPQRVCLLRYEGKRRFVVVDSERTRLLPGDSFTVGIIIEGEPLYIDNLQQRGRHPVAYKCGLQGGIRFEILPVA